MKKLIIIFLSIVVSSIAVNAQFGGGETILSTNIGGQVSLAVDLDGDGKKDVLVASQGNYNSYYFGKLFWLKNLGGGTFDSTVMIIENDLQQPSSLCTSDFDNDGDSDLVISSQIDNKVAYFENLGGGVFGPQQTISSNVMGASDVYSVDLDGDGNPDLLVASYDADKISWFPNVSGVFGSEQVITTLANGASSVYGIDLDNDGDVDIISGSRVDNKVAWYENLGLGSFGPQNVIGSSSSYITSVSAGDLDGDGDNEILSGADFSNRISIYDNLGGGTFSSPTQIANGNSISDLTVEDMDNDGDFDVIFSASQSRKLGWLKNNGTGTFGLAISLSTSLSGEKMCVGDLDGDTLSDVIFVQTGGSLSWVNNAGGGTFNQDQRFEIPDTPYDVKVGDLDNDGDDDVVFGGGRTISWIENNGAGGYSEARIIAALGDQVFSCPLVWGGIGSVWISDADGDLDGDIMFSISCGNPVITTSICWIENQGNGNFSNIMLIGNGLNNSLAYATDINGSGLDDVLVKDTDDDKIYWYVNTGGSFSGPSIVATLNNLWGVHSADLDNDGDIDVIAQSSANGTIKDQVVWYENQGGGSFGPVQIVTEMVGSAGSHLRCADIDNDGYKDVLFAETGNVYWCRNNGNGSIDSTRNLVATQLSWYFELADINMDNNIDVIVRKIHTNNSGLFWHENLGAGIFDTVGLILDTNSFWATGMELSDMNFDGDADIVAASTYTGKVKIYSNHHLHNRQIQGLLYIDQNQNGMIDTNEVGLNQIAIQSNPTSDFTFTYPDGQYFMNFSDTSGNYEILPQPLPHWTITSDSLSYHIHLDSIVYSMSNLDFGFYPSSPVDSINTEVIGGFPRCNDTVNYWIDIKNVGSSIVNGTLELEIDDSLMFVGANPIPDSVVGQHIYWNYDSLYFFDSRMINLWVVMPDFVSSGDTLSSFLFADVLDSLSNSTFQLIDTLNQVVVCAYDPNDKIAFPSGVDNMGYIHPFTNQIEYTIRFQNTGNDTALTVVIRDQLDSNLIWNSFVPLASSHEVITNVDQMGEVTLTFTNIMLPDSGADKLGSNGFIKYRVDLKQNLPLGTSILNYANIYFDNNPAVITNTKINTLYDCGSLQFNLSTFYSCLNNEISGTALDNISTSIYNWAIDSFYASTGSTLSWLADTVGQFDLSVSTINPFCTKDTNVQINIYPQIDITVLDTSLICEGDSLMIFGENQNSSGLYYDTLQSVIGCDSVIARKLELLTLPIVSIVGFIPDTLCDNDAPVILPVGSPLGGVYSGNGVGGGNFDPVSAGVGTHPVIYTYSDSNSCVNSDTTIVVVELCLGVNESLSDFGILIYPNPNTGLFTVEKPASLGNQVEVRMLDGTGKLIVEKIIPIKKQKVDIDFTNYGNGIYYLQLVVGDEVFLQRILKQ